MSKLESTQNRAKLFIWNNTFSKAIFTNSGGAPVTINKGMLLGRLNASNAVMEHTKGATDGSQHPMGILADDYTVAAGASITVTYCTGGNVDKALVKCTSTDTLVTVIAGLGTIGDVLERNTTIKLVDVIENTY